MDNVPLPNDDPNLVNIREIKIRGCGCKNKCVFIFSDDTLYSHTLNMKEMSKEEKDGSIIDSCKETIKRGKKIIRSRVQTDFYVLGKRFAEISSCLSMI